MELRALSIDQHLISSARDLARRLLGALADLPGQPLDVARSRAAEAVEQYSTQLIDELVAAVPSNSTSEGARVKSCYTELALEFAQSVRDLEPDPERRHDIAHAIQFKILESERRLRSLLEALAPSASRQL